MNWNFLQKQKAAISKILAATILCTSVFHPVMTLPAYATDSMVTVNCESTKPDDIQIYVSSETVDLGPGNDIYLQVCVQNNTDDTIEDGILTWSDPEYVLSDDTSGFTYEGEDAWTDESRYLYGISLLPGETLEAEFSGTLDPFLDTDTQCKLEFEFISDNETWNTVFPFTSGIVNLMPVEIEPVIAGETGSMILTFAVNPADEIIDLDPVLVATPSDAYESDKGTPSNATASNASPSDASLSDADPLFSLDGIELKLKTYGFDLSDICVTDVSYSEMMEYVDVTVEYVVSADSNSGNHIGVIMASVHINDTFYNIMQSCNNVIVENPESKYFKIVDTVNQRINELPDKDFFFNATDIFVNNEMWEDYDKYMKSLASSVIPIWELYLSLPESYHSLIINIDLLEFYYGLISNISFSGTQDQYSIIYSAADLSGCIRTTSLNNTTVSTNTVSGIIDSVILTVNNTSTTADDPYIWIDFPSAIDTEEYPFLSVKYKLLAGSAENIQMQIFPIEEGESASAQTSVICPIMGNSTEYSNCMFQFSNCQKYHDDPKTSGRLIKSIRLDYIDIFKVTDYSSGSHDSTEHGTVNGSQIQIESVTFHTMHQPDDIVPVESDAIKFQLFNYNQNINKTYDGTDWKPIASYFTFRGKNGISQSEEVLFEDASIPEVSMNKTFDVDGFVLEHATVERTLDESGYPVLDLTRFADGSSRTDENGNELLPDSILSQEDRSMKYLWSDEDPACKMYEPENGILQYNESNGLYYYDSRYNAVDYDVYQDRFYLRGYKERNNTTATYLKNTDETTGSVIPYYDLHPFDFTGGLTAGITSGDQIYQVKDLASDCWFGLRMDVDFYQGKNGEFMGQDMIFSFTGDDDIWVFVDDTLVLDLGGTHGAVTGTINFATGEINQYFNWNGTNALEGDLVTDTDTYARSYQTSLKECFSAAGTTPFGGWDEQDVFSDYTVHKLSFFYLERGAAVANCALNFNLPTLPENSLKIAKELVSVEDDDLYEYIENSLYYTFRTLQTDKDGNVTDIPFIPENTLFSIYENDVLVDGAGVVEEDGYFYLKAGQSALFENVMELFDGDNPNNYIVEEILPVEFSG
ncbi:MAG: hypothetical protein IJO13_07955, partial [Lachnospiraceae bacterium]|nr:hypothetical protein [Lachnospiraceae bacterium]